VALYKTYPISLSVLDQSPIPEGDTAGQALRNSIELARLADRLGYTRYWVAEHHGTPGLACNSPEALIGPIASATAKIRVGSGGIMLPHYSPLKVAETFSMLSGMFPGRIDLGIGRAAGTSPNVALALQRDRRQRAPDDFREQLDELLTLLANGRPSEVNFPRLPLGFMTFESPEPWLLGSSPQSAVWAAELGLPYVFADFINADGAAIASYYRSEFRPSETHGSPRAAVAVWAICADTDEEAFRQSLPFRMMMRMMHRGRLIAVPTIETAEGFLAADGVPADYMPPGRRIITGSPETVRRSIEGVAEEYGATEVLIVNIMHDHAARLRSYELIADAFSSVREESLMATS
jgi:luciferase family oxidoreductase group 1